MAVPEVPKTFIDQMQEQIANLNTEQQWQEFKDTFNDKLLAVKDSLSKEQLVRIQESLEARWAEVKETASDSIKISRDVLKNIIDIQLDMVSEARKALNEITSGAAETSTTAVGAVIGGGALGKGLDMMSNVLESIGKVASDVWEYLKPYLEKFASTPFVKFFIGEEGERKLQAWLGINHEMEQLKQEITDRLPNNVELIPDTANKQNDRKAMIKFNDSYESLTSKPKSKGQFFYLLFDKLNLNPAPKTAKTITLTQIADAAAEYAKEQQPVPAVPATTPATASTPASSTTPAK